MTFRDSHEDLSTWSSLGKESSRNCAVSISSPQRKRPTLQSTRKENVAVIPQEKRSAVRRVSKSNRFSDRWSILNRIIRTSKTTASREQPLQTDGSDSSSDTEDEDEDEDDDIVFVQALNLKTHFSNECSQQRVIHPASPAYPSPLSGVRPLKRLLLARHNYPHRGYSQSALYHQRELWRKRKGEWDDYEYLLYHAGVSLEEAYGGFVQDVNGHPYSLPPRLHNIPGNRLSSSSSNNSSPVFVNPAIFPRIGDLSSTRDPFLISVDTWFAGFPLWTLSKLVWIYDVNHRAGTTAHEGGTRRLSSSFLDDLDSTGDASAESFVTSCTDSSDTTLVDSVHEGTQLAKDAIGASTRFDLDRKPKPLPASSPDSNSSGLIRSWETCWFSRWEILYNQISLASELAGSPSDLSSIASGSKEAIRVILTNPGTLYDPHQNNTREQSEAKGEDIYLPPSRTSSYGATPVEDDDDDYGNVIYSSESHYRIGAHVNPLSMFATAAKEQETSLTSDCSSTDSDSVLSRFSKDYVTEVTGGMQKLTVCC